MAHQYMEFHIQNQEKGHQLPKNSKQNIGYVNELMAELLLTREVHPTYKRALAISSLENQGQPSPVAETLFRRPKLDTYDKSSTCIRVNIHTGYLNPQNSSDGKLSLILLQHRKY
ncbi:hypothetical protein KUTeg_017397 [Tegillarca granosa]|uniref:Uncharacterized protein n=1 Tax=Tegillarca granosa TaxID=220873 RepID=A0ABQ9EJS9_TEGGR|nr:hypothetical protein KUTeg_017397 [Tegillarca granosa]